MENRPAAQREYGLDVLRVFAFGVLILYHSGMGYVTWGWHVKNNELSTGLEWVMLFANRWRLPLLFFISGAGVAFSLRRRTMGEFARERAGRLLPPLLMAIFVVVPPQIYFEHVAKGREYGSYFEFWKTVFQFVPYPKGAFSWHHMWFVVYILVYALASIPLFVWLRGEAGRRFLAGLAGWLESSPVWIYLVTLPNLVVALTLGPRFPTTNALIGDWANLTGAWLTFLWGYVFASERRLLDLLERRRREFLIGAVLVVAVFYGMRMARVGGLAGELASSYFGMLFIFWLTGYARAWFRSDSRWLRYWTEGVFPLYLIHQTVTVALVFAMREWEMSLWVKLGLAAAGTFAGSIVFADLARRTGPLRPWLGLKAIPSAGR
ncbi:MAG: acyltransferase family protein [Bryobacteraceae bacterium]